VLLIFTEIHASKHGGTLWDASDSDVGNKTPIVNNFHRDFPQILYTRIGELD
jgi:hypothetical protein